MGLHKDFLEVNGHRMFSKPGSSQGRAELNSQMVINHPGEIQLILFKHAPMSGAVKYVACCNTIQFSLTH